MSGEPRVRASDAERERVATVLRAAMTEGRLSLSEGEERLTTAYASTYRDELTGLTADLPPAAGQGRSAGRWAGRFGDPRSEPWAEPDPAEGPERGSRADAWRRRRRGRPAIILALVVALAMFGWAAVGQPVWPLIIVGALALCLAKPHCGRRPHRDPARH